MAVQKYGAPIRLAEAEKVLAAAQAEAQANDWPVVIAVSDSAGHLVTLKRMDHAQVGSVAIAQAKARTAVLFKRPTRSFEDGLDAGGRNLRALSMDGVCALEGGLLLLVDGAIVGGIGVSGVDPSDDGQIARAGAAALAD